MYSAKVATLVVSKNHHYKTNIWSKCSYNKAPKVQMPRCSSMYASLQLADAYDSTYACSRSMEASNSSMEARNVH